LCVSIVIHKCCVTQTAANSDGLFSDANMDVSDVPINSGEALRSILRVY